MADKINKRISKFLSLILRHRPEVVEIKLDDGGWAKVEELIQKVNAKGEQLTLEQLEFIVDNNDKKRFTFNDDKTLIRASQGHSIEVDLGLQQKTPPSILYHGTAVKNIASIEKQGLLKRNRNHVHLSANIELAIQVGQRHGKPVVFEIDALTMNKDGYRFFLSKNEVWLTEEVPVKYLKKMS
ncbi:MAG: RNA 2'-phosphotransferase [Bacteroidota bacterium]